jgi:hypothetical protein
MNRIVAALFALFLGVGAAEAGSSTLGVTPGTGATFGVVTDGGGNFHPYGGICDYSACANGWSIDANHGGLVAGEGIAGTPAGGVVSIQGVGSGTAVPVSGAFWQTTQPISAASLPLPSGAASAANQATNGATTSHTCSTGGFSELGCLGQIDDDIKGAIPAGTNNVGFVGVYGATYNAIAASQTAQALTGGSGGATGDYLSHCVVLPTSTSPGVVTIKDNTTTIYAFPGGSSSLSNLVPFTIPVGAKSVSGAWTVTTGANLTAVCVGKFT